MNWGRDPDTIQEAIKKMKLSPRQAEVIRLMQEGWEMSVSTSHWVGHGVWLQENGVGGETKQVNGNTFNSLVDRGLIVEKRYGFPTSIWRLTRKARRAMK